MSYRRVVPAIASLLVLAACSDAERVPLEAPTRASLSAQSGSPTVAPSLPDVDDDVFARSGTGSESFVVTLRRPVGLQVACTGAAKLTLATRPAVTGLSTPCDGAQLTSEVLRLSRYPQRVVFSVGTEGPIEWRLGLFSDLFEVDEQAP